MIFRIFSISIVFLLISFALFCCFYEAPFRTKFLKIPRPSDHVIFFLEMAIIALSLYLSLFLSILTPRGDSAYFATVIAKLLDEPFSGFYTHSGITYPPLFNYLFYLLGLFLRHFGIPIDCTYRSFVFFIKLPGICCEFLMAALIYQLAKKYTEDTPRIIILFLVLLNPGYLFITCYISQVDALYTFFMLLTLYLIYIRRLRTSYFAFAAAILFKFQAIFITPVLIFAIINQVFLHDFGWKKFFAHLGSGLLAIACMALSYLPFAYDFSFGATSQGILENFTSSVASYGYASQNAYNFWTLIGYNWYKANTFLGPFPCNTWGTIFIILLVFLSILLFWKNRHDTSIYPQLAALLVSGTFCFSVKMMARYLYPAIILLIFGYTLKPTLKRLTCAVSFSIAFFLASTFNYMVYPHRLYSRSLVLPYVISFYVLACFFFLVYTIWSEGKSEESGAHVHL